MTACGSILRVLCALFLSAAPGLMLLPNTVAKPAGELLRLERQVHQYVNEARRANHLPELKWNEQIAAEARRHADNIVERRFFSHRDPLRGNIDSRLNRSGVDWQRCAENLYEGNYGDPAREAVQAWLRSRDHRQNIMDSMFSDAGVGVAQRGDGGIIVVQEYVWK